MKSLTLLAAGAFGILLMSVWGYSYAQNTARSNQSSADESDRQTKLPVPVIDTHDLMSLFNEPLLKRLQDAMSSKPTDQTAWAAIADHGRQAAEIANLIAIREMQEKHPRWVELCAPLQFAAIDLAEAGDQNDFQAATVAYRNLIQRCNDCHQQIAAGHAPILKP